jgi:hypothetical protein
MRPLQTVVIEIAFGRVDYVPNRYWTSLYGWPTPVTDRGRCEYFVMDSYQRNRFSPGAV